MCGGSGFIQQGQIKGKEITTTRLLLVLDCVRSWLHFYHHIAGICILLWFDISPPS